LCCGYESRVEEDAVDGAAERPNKSVRLGVIENTYLTSI
jgi:hypothetical protein